MKYIMLDHMGLPQPITFSEILDHSFLAQSIKETHPGIEITSAGFCTSQGNTYGESVTLKLKPADDDSYWIKKMMGIDVLN